MFKNKLLVLAVVAVLAVGVYIVSDDQNNNKGGLIDNVFTLSFDPNGGECDQGSKTVTYGEPYGALPRPTNDIDYFLGWFTDPKSGTQVTEDTIYSIKGDSTVHAHWMTVFRITYVLNSPTAVNDADNFRQYSPNMGDIILHPASDYGRSFSGWYLDETCTEILVKKIDTSSWWGDVTLYAKWA